MEALLSRPAPEAARRIALALVGEAHAAERRLGAGEDKEALHDFRVALRRLRSHSRAHAPRLGKVLGRRARRRIKDIAGATGGARDAEVLLGHLERLAAKLDVDARAQLAPFRAALHEERRRADASALRKARKRFRQLAPQLRRGLGTFTLDLRAASPPRFGVVLAGLARERTAALLATFEEAQLPESGESEGDEAAEQARREALHDARIDVKRLRYLLEPVRPEAEGARALVSTLKGLQDLLGDLHDLHVLEDRLRAAPTDPATRAGMAALLEATVAAAETLELRVRTEWMGGGLGVLRDAVETLAAELEGSAHREIERKFLLRHAPQLAGAVEKELAQGYLPGDVLRERLRRVRKADGSETYLRTVKLGRGIERIEIEESTTKALYDQLWPLTEGCRVVKRRHVMPDGWVVDEFLDRTLWLAEIELPSADVELVIPDWLAPSVEREVTEDPTYLNLNLAR
ncbi:MAG: CHAD domain-containing protein [Myxococcota bacterium]